MANPAPPRFRKDTGVMRAPLSAPLQRNFACGVNCLPERCGTDRSRLNWIKLLQLHFPTCGLNLNAINFMVSY